MKLKSTVPAAIAATCLMTQPALAYHFSPTQIRSVISGKMTLTPTNTGQPFSCQVQINLRTYSQTNVPQIERVKARGAGFCRDILFVGLPWQGDIMNSSGGLIIGGSWRVGSEDCSGYAITFTVGAKGHFTLQGCLLWDAALSPPGQKLSLSYTRRPNARTFYLLFRKVQCLDTADILLILLIICGLV